MPRHRRRLNGRQREIYLRILAYLKKRNNQEQGERFEVSKEEFCESCNKREDLRYCRDACLGVFQKLQTNYEIATARYEEKFESFKTWVKIAWELGIIPIVVNEGSPISSYIINPDISDYVIKTRKRGRDAIRRFEHFVVRGSTYDQKTIEGKSIKELGSKILDLKKLVDKDIPPWDGRYRQLEDKK